MKVLGGTQVLSTLALALTALGCGSSGADNGVVAMRPAGGAGSPADGATSPPGATPPARSAPSRSAPSRTTPFDVAHARIGTNLVAVSYYSPQWPFVDAMKVSRVSSKGFPWDLVAGDQPTPALDPQGYPIGLGSAQSVSTLMLRGVGEHFPAGEYVVLFEGEGRVELSWDGGRARHEHDGEGTARFTADVTPSDNGLILKITRSNARNHVRDLRVIMPGFEATYAAQPFHPLFLERLAPYAVLRFMDWGQTNRSPITSWSERKLPDYRSQHGQNGVAYELMADLCNRTGKHPWVCVPHLADDDYVRQLAELLRDEVDPGLKVFVEYSNEVWNGAFSQHHDVKKAAAREGLEWYAGYTRRSLRIFDIFEEVFGGTDRLVRVLGAQAGNPWIGQKVCEALPGRGQADALAIAPYFGGRLGNRKHWRATRGWSVSEVLDACEADLAEQRELMRKYKAQAEAAGLALIAYEGGQHLAAVGEAVDDPTLVELFKEANRHPRMKALYLQHLADWRAAGGGTYVHFNDVFVPQKWGCWGALEHQDSDPAASPKYSALAETARAWTRAAAPVTSTPERGGAR